MFECGLEGVNLKVVKKSQFEHVECNITTQTEVNSETRKSKEDLDQSSTATPKLNDNKTNNKPSGKLCSECHIHRYYK